MSKKNYIKVTQADSHDENAIDNSVYIGDMHGCEVDGEFMPLKDFLATRWWMNDVDGEPI